MQKVNLTDKKCATCRWWQGTRDIHEFVHFESDFVRDLGASEERREAVIRVLELAYDTTFPEAIRASVTTPISAYIALVRVGKIDDEEAKHLSF